MRITLFVTVYGTSTWVTSNRRRKNEKIIATCAGLDLETQGFWPTEPKNLPGHTHTEAIVRTPYNMHFRWPVVANKLLWAHWISILDTKSRTWAAPLLLGTIDFFLRKEKKNFLLIARGLIFMCPAGLKVHSGASVASHFGVCNTTGRRDSWREGSIKIGFHPRPSTSCGQFLSLKIRWFHLSGSFMLNLK